jgi:hypothetical protein
MGEDKFERAITIHMVFPIIIKNIKSSIDLVKAC